ncbi:uncharacterized protein LOC142585335 isoform X1 [Dermacentor variabilis]|uniref:uncharacterized protein LOC142585335 isoform X1 n=1 Tax=Dermacentor variabilis TaxID=34621 RepID=UPI003F5B5C99
MEDISLPHDTRVEDILADYFTKKIEGKDAEAKEKRSDSQHSSKSKKSKKRKHKKKKKHKSRKAHSGNEEDEPARSSADECWVEVTVGNAKENSAKDKSDSTDKEPKKKLKSKSKRKDTSASSNTDAVAGQDMPKGDKDGACKDDDHSSKGGSDQKEPTSKDNVKQQAEHSGRSSRKSSSSTSPAKSNRASSSSDSDDDHKNASTAEPASHTSEAESSKKTTKKKGRSYRTKRCRSSGSSESSEDDQDKQSRSRSRSLSHGASPRHSRQNRARSSSRSRHDTQSKDLRRERSKSRDDRKYDRSRDHSRSPKRSSPSRSQRRGRSRSQQSRSPARLRTGRSRSPRRSGGHHSRSPRRTESLRCRSPRRSEGLRNRSPRRTEGHRSRSPRRSEGHRSRSPRRSENRRSPSPSRSRRWSGSKHSRGRTSPRRSQSRKRSESRQRGRRSQSPSSKQSRRSTSRDKKHVRKSRSPKGERKSRSRSRKRSVSKERRSSRHSKSGERNSSDDGKSDDRDKSREEKTSTVKAPASDKSSASSVDADSKQKQTKSGEEKAKRDKVSDKESSTDAGKNQVVLYGPFEEEASFDEEPSPERAEPTSKVLQPETCSGVAGKTSKHQPATSSLDAVPLPAEPVAQSEDTLLEDMDISDSPSSGGVLEVEDSLNQNLPSGENQCLPSITSRHQTETRASQQCVQPQKVATPEDTSKKATPVRAAIPWNYNEAQPPPQPWVKPEVTKPVGQVRPFVREVSSNESAVQKGLSQVKQDGVGAVMATVQPSTDPPLSAPSKATNKAEELSALASPAAKVAEQPSFPDLSAKLLPQMSLTTVPPPVNVHGGALYSATVMPVHVTSQCVGMPGHGQAGPGAMPPVTQEKPPHVIEQQQQQSPPRVQQSRDNQGSDSVDSSGAASKVVGLTGSESVPSSPTKESKNADTAPDVGAAENTKDTNESESSSRSSSPAEQRSRSSSKERLNSRMSRSCSGDRETAKRSRSSESQSPSNDSKRLRKDDRTDLEKRKTKSESHDRRGSASPDRSARDSRARKKSVSPDRKQSKSHDRKRSKSRDKRRSKSRDRRSKSRDRCRSHSRDRKGSPSRKRRRSKSRERRPSKNRERKRSKSRDRKRSKSRDRKKSRSRERQRSKSRERKRSKSRDRRRSKSRDRRRSRSRDRKRSKSRERRSSAVRSGVRSSRRRSGSRSRRSRSRDQSKRHSRSRERMRPQRSQSRGRDSSRRRSRDKEMPRGCLILKGYKNELSSESESSPERKSTVKPSSPIKKRQRRESDAESVDSEEDKPEDNRVASPMMSDTSKPDADGKGDYCTDSGKEKELQKLASSETLGSKDKLKDAPYGPLPPNEASTSPPVMEVQHSDDKMDDEQDVQAGSDGCSPVKTKPDGKALGAPVVSSSSTKESICSVKDTLVASSESQSASLGDSQDSKTRRSPEPKQDRQEKSANKEDKAHCEKLIIPSGESAVSSSTGSPGDPEGQPKSRPLSGTLHTDKLNEENSPSEQRPVACTDDSGVKKPSTMTVDKAREASCNDDTRSTSDSGRKSRSRSPSSTSSIEKARTRKQSSSSSRSRSHERHTSKEPSKSRSTSPDSPGVEMRDESPEKKSQGQVKKRSRSREKKRSKSREKKQSPSRSREKKRSHSREKKRSVSREKKRSKSRERRTSPSRDRSRRSREKKRSRSREKKRSPSREKKRSRSRDKRRSRSREKRRSRSRDKKRSRSRDKKRSRSREKKRSISRERRRSRSRDRRRSRSRDKKISPIRDRKRSRSRERRRSRDKKSPSRSRDRRRSRSRERRRSRSRARRSWSRAMELQRRRSAERLRKKSRSPRKRSLSKRRSPPPRKKSRSRSRSRRRSRTHSPERKRKSRSREREPSVVKVDKAQLLEAARKNMQAMLQRGVVAKGLPVAAAAAVNATVKVVAAAVAAAAADPKSSLAARLDVGAAATSTPPSEAPVLPLALSGDGTGPSVTLGITEEPPKVKRSLAALTEICKAISDEEKREYAGEVEPKTAEEVAEEFQQTHHHPFKLKEPPPPIRFNIPNATNLPVKTLAEKVADAAHLHKQFPVSSGNQHRVKELEWVPVEKTEPAPKAARAAAAKSRAAPPKEGGTSSPLALMPPPSPSPTTDTFSPLPTVATPPVFQMEDVPLPVSSAVISSTVMEPPDPALAGNAKTAKTDEGTAHQEEAEAQPEGASQTTVGDLDNDHASNLHTLDKSDPGKSDSLDDSEEDKTAEAKHDNVDDSQHKMECNTFADDLNPTFLFEEVPLESIPLPEGPYIPPETKQCVSLEHQASVSVPDTQPQDETAKKSRNWDVPPEQWLSQKAVSDDKDSISESSIKPTAKCLIETELKSVKLDEQEFAPKVKSQEVTPSKQKLSNKIKEPPQPEPSQQSNLPTSKKSELDCQKRAARKSESKHKEKAPVINKEEQHSLQEVQLEVDKVSEPIQPPEPTNIRAKLRKLRRESLMSVLNFEPLEITPKTAPIQSFEMKQDGASLCKQAWSRISALQKESAYFSAENKKVLPESSKPVRNNKEDSSGKTELCRSQSPSKTQNPSVQTKGEPSYSSSEKSSSEKKKVSPEASKPVQYSKEDSTSKTEIPSIQKEGKPSSFSSEEKKVLPEPAKPVQNNKEDSNSKTELHRPQTLSKTQYPSVQIEGKASYFSFEKKKVLPEPSKPVQNNKEGSTDETELHSSQSPSKTKDPSIQTKGKPSYSSSEKKNVSPEPSKPVQNNKKDSSCKTKLHSSQLPSKTKDPSLQTKGTLLCSSSEKKKVSPEPSKPVQNNEKDNTGKTELRSSQLPSKTKDPSIKTKGKPSYSSSEKKIVLPESSKPVQNNKDDSTGKTELQRSQSPSKTQNPSIQMKGKSSHSSSEKSSSEKKKVSPEPSKPVQYNKEDSTSKTEIPTIREEGKPPYLSSEKKKILPKPARPVQNNKEDSSSKTELHRSQTPSKTQSPSVQMEGKPSYSSSQKKNVLPDPSKPVQNNKEDSSSKTELYRSQTPSKAKDPSLQTEGRPPYFSSEKKKLLPEPFKPVQNRKEDSTGNTELHSSQPPSKTKDPSLQKEGKPSSVDSVDNVQQPTTAGYSGTTASQRKSDRFLRRQIQGNIAQLMPGYLTFGNMIVNPAPPVHPPVRDQANKTSAKLSGPPSGKCDQNVISSLERGPTTQPASFTVEESRPMQNQATQNSVTPREANKCADTDSERSHGNAQSASTTVEWVATNVELSAKRETRDDNKTRQSEPGGLPVKSRGQSDSHEHKEHTAVLPEYIEQSTEGQQTALLPRSKSTPCKQTQDSTSTQSEDLAARISKHVPAIGITTARGSHTALSPKNEMLSHQAEPENPLPQLQEQISKAGSSTKPTENAAATRTSELQDEDNACRQAQITVVEAGQDKLAINPKEQATASLTESIAPRMVVAQYATSTLDNSNEDITGKSEVNVEHVHLGPDVSHKPSDVPVSLALTESTQSSTVQEVDSAVRKHGNLSTEDVTPVHELTMLLSADSPTVANQKVQEPQQASTKQLSSEPECFALEELLSAPTTHKQGPEHSSHCEQGMQLGLEPKPLSEPQKPETIISTSGLAARAVREGTLPQQDSSATMSTEHISPSLKPTTVMLSTSYPSPAGCTTEMKALLPKTDDKNAAQELRLNHPCTETSGKPMVHVVENSNRLSDNSEAKSMDDGPPLEQSQKSTQHDLQTMQMSHEPAGKASGFTLLSAAVTHNQNEKLAASVPEHSLPSLPTESLETKPVLYELLPGDNGASTCEILENRSEWEPVLTKYDNTTSSKDNKNESVSSYLNAEESSAQQGELESEYIEETSDLVDKFMQPASDITGDQPQRQAMAIDHENLSKDLSMKDREDKETSMSFSQLQRFSEMIDVTSNLQRSHNTTTDTAATIQYQFEKDIGTDEVCSITATEPSQGVQTENTSLLSKNENVTIEQTVSVSSHTAKQFADGSRKSPHLVCGTNQLEMTANDGERDLNVRPSSENAGDESKILSKEHASTKRTENESLLTQERENRTFKAEAAKSDEITASGDYEDTKLSPEHSADQHALFILDEARVCAEQGELDNATVLEQSDDSTRNRVLEVKMDILHEGVTHIVQDLTMTPVLEGTNQTVSLLSNQETTTVSHTDLSHPTEDRRRDSGSEFASEDEIKDLQSATADDGEQDYTATPASKDDEYVSATNQKWASHGQEVADISPIEALTSSSTDEPVFVGRIVNLKEGAACAEQDHSAISTSSHVEAESMLILPTEEKTSTELTNLRSTPLLEGREKDTPADVPPLEDRGEQHHKSNAVTEHNILATLSARDKSGNAYVPFTGQEAHLNLPITQRNAPISEKLCELEMSAPAVQAFASNLRDVSRPTSVQTNSGDNAGRQLHEVRRAVAECETEPASSFVGENILNLAKQANARPGHDQLQRDAPQHETNATAPPVPNWALHVEESAGKLPIGSAEVDESEILVIAVAEESLSEESRDRTDSCQQHDHVNENIPRPTQHSTPSFTNQSKDGKMASAGVMSSPCEPDIEGNANQQQNTIIQPEQPGVSPRCDASAELTLFASSLEKCVSTSGAEAAIVLSTQAGLEDIEVASVIEVSAEEIILSADVSPTHSCQLTESSRKVSVARTNEQSSQLVSTSEGRGKSIAFADGHPALLSSDQRPAEFLIIGSCNEELSVIPLAEQEVRDHAAEETGNVAGGMPRYGALLSPEATLNELLCEEEIEPAPPTITDGSSHLQHSQEIRAEAASKLTTPSETRLAGVDLESQLLPLPTLPQTPLTNPSVVRDGRLQPHPEPLSTTSSCSHYGSTQELLEPPAEDSALQPRHVNAISIHGNAPSMHITVSVPPSQAGNEEASLDIPSMEESVDVAVSLPSSQTGNEEASLDIPSTEVSVEVAVSLPSSQAGNEEASLDIPSMEETVDVAVSLPPSQTGNEEASLDIPSMEVSLDVVPLPSSQAGNEDASFDIPSTEESVDVAVSLPSSQAGNEEANLDIPSTEESVDVALSLPSSQAGNEEASLHIPSMEESVDVAVSLPSSQTGNEEASLDIPSTEVSVDVAVPLPSSKAGNEDASFDIPSTEESVDVALSLPSSQAGNEEADLDIPSTEESVDVVSLPSSQAGNEEASLDIPSMKESVDVAVSLPSSQTGNEEASWDILGTEESIHIAVLLPPSQAGNEASLGILSMEESRDVGVSLLPSQAGNEEASLDIHSMRAPIHATKSLPSAVTESTRQEEAEKQLVELTEQMETTRGDTLAGEEVKNEEPAQNIMPLRKRPAMRQLPGNFAEECTLLNEQSPSSLSSHIETLPEEHKPKKAATKPKRRGRTSLARSQGESDEAETLPVRRSTRNKKPPERFCF